MVSARFCLLFGVLVQGLKIIIIPTMYLKSQKMWAKCIQPEKKDANMHGVFKMIFVAAAVAACRADFESKFHGHFL